MGVKRNALGEMCCQTMRGVFIPGCMGGAVYGKSGCTCQPVRKVPSIRITLSRMERHLRSLSRDVERLKRKLSKRERSGKAVG